MSKKKQEETQDAANLKKIFEKRNFYTIKDSGLVYILALIIPLFVSIAFLYLAIYIALNTGLIENSSSLDALYNKTWFVLPYVLLTQFSFLGIYFFYHKTCRLSFKATKISFKQTNAWTAVICALTGVICVFGFIWLIEGCFGGLFSSWGIESSSLELKLDSVGWLFVNLLVLGLIPAVCEELIFRGIIYKGLKEKFSVGASVLLSALLFALMHQNIFQFVYPFILGCVLAVVMECTNNLLYTMILHCFNNFTTIILSYLSEIGVIDLSFSFMTGAWAFWGWILAIVIAIACLGILFVVWKFYLSKHKKLEETPVGEANQSSTMVGKMPLSMFIGIILAAVIVVINALG